MSHFYGGISGSRGPATRQGTASSGISGYVQSWQTRFSVSMDNHGDTDNGHFHLGPGPSNHSGGGLTMSFVDTSVVIDALSTGDPKIDAIRKRIHAEIEKLNAEAPKAVKRAEARRRKEERAAKRAEKARTEMQAEVMRDMLPEEKARVVRLLTPRVNLDAEGNFESDSKWALCASNMGDLRRGNDGHVYVTSNIGGNWGRFTADITAGQWVLPEGLTPDDLGLTELIEQTQLGWREEVIA